MTAPIKTSTTTNPEDPQQSATPNIPDKADTRSILDQFQIDHLVAPTLPPNVRDQLLDYLQTWGRPEELLALL